MISHVAMETYWREVRSIEEEEEGEEEEEEEEMKSMDEEEALLSTLTRQQAATVRKRLDNYTETLKTRNRQPIRDVRDIFPQVFVPVSPPQSLTAADDLSSCDLTRLGFISHIELSTFLLALGVQTKRTRPPRRRTRDGGVFGVSLNSLLENDRKTFPGVKVPVVFQKLLCILEETGLETEGILRVPGSAARLKSLRRELDRSCGAFDWSAVRQVDAAGLLKLFIRELPTPLLTHTHLSTYRVSSVVHQIQALQLLALLLPEANRDTLRALLVFLRQVVSHQDRNRMSLWNVSMVMAPNLFTCPRHGNKRSIARQREEMEEAVAGAHLVQLMVTHQDLLWTVRQTGRQTDRQTGRETETDRERERDRQGERETDKERERQTGRERERQTGRETLCEGVIRVHAPLHAKVSMAIQLDGQTRARDVIARFGCDTSCSGQHLYEVGGNICERRLHPDCVLLDVYRVNPHCDWMIKP
uniref:Rho-GAP domain-containing protein n=1 Tax=Sander lucioperca TaxID=283035 RepID=A0A8C9XUL4_SANLU